MKQNRFFSAVYIIGTGLAISMVMTMAVVWHIRMSDVAPEVSRSRSYFTSNATYKSKEQGYSSMSMLGYRLVRELLPELKVPEHCCVSVSPSSMGYLLGGVFLQTPGGEETLETELRPCDAAFWQVFRLRFMAGAPFTEEEVASGVKRIVLAESLARRLFGSVDVTGREVLMNYIPYTVAGVVEDVSLTATDAYAEAWVPYSSVEQLVETDEQGGSVGGFNPVFVLKRKRETRTIKARMIGVVRKKFWKNMFEKKKRTSSPTEGSEGRLLWGMALPMETQAGVPSVMAVMPWPKMAQATRVAKAGAMILIAVPTMTWFALSLMEAKERRREEIQPRRAEARMATRTASWAREGWLSTRGVNILRTKKPAKAPRTIMPSRPRLMTPERSALMPAKATRIRGRAMTMRVERIEAAWATGRSTTASCPAA